LIQNSSRNKIKYKKESKGIKKERREEMAEEIEKERDKREEESKREKTEVSALNNLQQPQNSRLVPLHST
jgi:hypothetical protein